MKRNPRKVIVEILEEIFENGAYSNIVLKKVAKSQDIDDLDKGLIYRIVYGVVENKIYLDYIIRKLSSVRLKKIDNTVLNILRMSVYQINFMDKIPSFAVVNEAVKITKKYNGRYGAFVNGILRNYLRNMEKTNEIVSKNNMEYLSIKYSYPLWMIELFASKFGEDTESLLIGLNEEPKLVLRTNTLKIDRESLIKRLESIGMSVKKSEISSYGIILDDLGSNNIDETEEYKKGYYYVQDESSMLVAEVLDPKAGEKVLDLCSAPGGKTSHIAQVMNNQGQIEARDVFDHKLDLMNDTFDRLGINIVNCKKEDGTVHNSDYDNYFDKVLVDAPCSGLGIIKRKPEIKYNMTLESVKELSELQYNILLNASKYVKDDGILVFSTCTINDIENINTVNKFLKENSEFELVKIKFDSKEYDNIEMYPHEDNTDGFFICKLKKKKLSLS